MPGFMKVSLPHPDEDKEKPGRQQGDFPIAVQAGRACRVDETETDRKG